MSNLSVIQNVTEVRSDPFPYVCVEGAMPDRFYRELEATFPEDMIVKHTQPHDGGITYRFKCKEAKTWQVPAIWQDFFAYHTSQNTFALVQNYLHRILLQHMVKSFMKI